ncbi:hypothetical protein IFM89_000673 [Coptis chinensis]|uniref:AP2/ERF domain-containing protein n=1 Tax=Coptis chinensis TaxID=261450 RepID=A0A835M905_9MAGN|nr:hypothetical protein IFM89_000673 [Coptis chinensis]
MRNLTKEEFVHILRRHSTGFARGSSKYRGVTHHKCGRWEARMGQFLGKNCGVVWFLDTVCMHGNRVIIVENMTLACRYIYLRLFDSEVEAARSSRVFFKFVEGGQLTKLEGFRQSLFKIWKHSHRVLGTLSLVFHLVEFYYGLFHHVSGSKKNSAVLIYYMIEVTRGHWIMFLLMLEKPNWKSECGKLEIFACADQYLLTFVSLWISPVGKTVSPYIEIMSEVFLFVAIFVVAFIVVMEKMPKSQNPNVLDHGSSGGTEMTNQKAISKQTLINEINSQQTVHKEKLQHSNEVSDPDIEMGQAPANTAMKLFVKKVKWAILQQTAANYAFTMPCNSLFYLFEGRPNWIARWETPLMP